MSPARLTPVEEDGSVVSFSESVRAKNVYSTNDLQYTALADRLSTELSKVADREARRAASKKQVVVPQSLDVVEQADLEREYPEYDLKFANLYRPVHTALVARRALASDYMRDHLLGFVDSMVVVGGSPLNAVIQGHDGAHFEYDLNDSVAMNYAYDMSMSLLQLANASHDMRAKFGFVVPESNYADYLSGARWRRCVTAATCDHKAEGFIADLTLQPMSVSQTVAAMLQCEAEIGMVALPYHPLMMQAEEAELPGVGVTYAFGENDLVFKYPEGVAGLTAMPVEAWHEWLAVNHRKFETVKGPKVFMFERKVCRGCYMFIEITQVHQDTPKPAVITHALDLHDGAGLVKVDVWRLKPYHTDVEEPSSWEMKTVVHTESVVNKLYELGLSATPGQFNKYALLKRASVVDARVTTEGTSVTVSPAMTESEMLDLCAAVHARCYVDRYDMGRMNEAMRKNFDRAIGFAKLSWPRKVLALVVAIRNGMFDALLAGTLDKVRKFFDRLRIALGGLPDPHLPVFRPADRYVTFVDEAARWLRVWREVMSDVVHTDTVYLNGKGAYVVGNITAVGKSLDVSKTLAWYRTGKDREDIVDLAEPGIVTSDMQSLADALGAVNDLPTRRDQATLYTLRTAVPTADAERQRPDYNVDPDYIQTLTLYHEHVFPGMGLQDFSLESAALALDPQQRLIDADRLRLPSTPSELPPERHVYKSNIRAYNVEKRPQTMPELLSAVTARNMSAPRLSLVQNTEQSYPAIWNNFLDTMCVSDARAKLVEYQSDVAGLNKEGFLDWAKKARPDAIKAMWKEMEDKGLSFEEYNVAEYIAMLKSDAKPPLSDKPLYARVEPQVIVYHRKILSSLYSSVYRVMTRRFLSLLKPTILLNLLKDRQGTRDHIQANHPWGLSVKFLENDFSKYDKSQGEFVFGLEAYVMEQLGMNQQLLDRWMEGHRLCKVRAFTLGMVFDIEWQRKSGDATTALGNGILNVLSVAYAYRGTDIKWAVFMGDDSLVCASQTIVTDDAQQILAEIFNLQAKFYITDAPYFASTFVNLDTERERVTLLPDPVKLMQRWSQSVDAKDPKWHERWVSAVDSCKVYEYRLNHSKLSRLVEDRYPVPVGSDSRGIGDAIATAISDEQRFRAIWQDTPTVIRV